MSVADKFQRFCCALRMSTATVNTVQHRYKQITQRLNRDFYGWDSDTLNSIYVGSYGRGTAIHVSDIDVLFKMPQDSYTRYNNYVYNGQSQLLQDLRTSLLRTYSSSAIKGDGQVTDIFFSDGMKFEIVPGIEMTDDTFRYPDSNGGGTWKVTDPRSEIAAVSLLDRQTNGTMRHLCRMVRAWKDTWNVPMGGLQIDTFAERFLKQWEYRDKSFTYYDWMTRDFFKWLSEFDDTLSYWLAIGSNQHVYNRGSFNYKAKMTCNIATEAVECENNGYEYTANSKWREIYGTKFPS